MALLIGAGVGGAACGASPPGTPDAAGDATTVKPGLTIAWHLSQPLPYLGTDRELLQVKLRMKTLRMVGDTAPDDVRTTKEQFDLKWKTTSEPDPTQFEKAPIGNYTSVKTRLDGDAAASFELEGRALVNGIWYPFEIEDSQVYSQTLPIAVTLDPDHGQLVHITANVKAVIDTVDFSLFQNDQGKLELRSGPELDKVRALMINTFSITQQ
ncbi:MAG: hypothetical protein KBG15_11680 [Kofleriaceae bacterium]|nr:hypothetical protein [Kofleriaceae bacterium]